MTKTNWTWTKSILIYWWNLKHGGTLFKNSLLNRHLMSWQRLLNRHLMSWLKMVMWRLSALLNKWVSQVRFLRSNLHLEFGGQGIWNFSSLLRSLMWPSGMKLEPKKVVSQLRSLGRKFRTGEVKPLVLCDGRWVTLTFFKLITWSHGSNLFFNCCFPSVVWDSDFTQ